MLRLSLLFGLVVFGSLTPSFGQFWDMMSNPQITIHLTHPPRLGLNLKMGAVDRQNSQSGPGIGLLADHKRI